MPTSRHDPSDALLPEVPEGYDEPVAFRYPLSVLLVVVGAATPVALFVFSGLLWYGQGPAALADLFGWESAGAGGEFTVSLPATIVATVVVAIVGVTIAHELVHGLVYRARGYDVTYGAAPHMGAFYAAAFHQFQGRTDSVLVGIAPLVVLTVLLGPVLFVGPPLVAFGAFVALLVNTLGAAGDLYLVAYVLRLPPGSLLYDSDIRHTYVYRPLT